MRNRGRAGKTCAVLEGLTHDRTRHGTVRWFYRDRRGKKQLRGITGEPPLVITADVLAAHADAKQRLDDVKPEKARGTLSWLFARYMATRSFRSELTRASYRSVLKGIASDHGQRPYATMMPRHVEALRDMAGGEVGNAKVKKLRQVFDWAMKQGLMSSNPARAVQVVKIPTRGHIPFTAGDVAAYERRHPPGTKAYLALALFLYSGARIGDVASFGPMNDRGGRLAWIQNKNRSVAIVRRNIPLIPPLRAALDASTLGTVTWLETEHGQPFSIKGLGNKMRQWCDEAGLHELSAHGIRKATGNIAAVRGASAHEIMEILGVTLTTAELYTREADALSLADSGFGKAFGDVP